VESFGWDWIGRVRNRTYQVERYSGFSIGGHNTDIIHGVNSNVYVYFLDSSPSIEEKSFLRPE